MRKQNNDVVFLQGKRLTLRPLLTADIPLLLRWINDPEVRQYLRTYLPQMEADEKEWIDGLQKRKQSDIVLMIVVGRKPIGVMGLHRIDWKDRVAATGAVIGEKAYWGKGYGTEAKMVLLNYAFNTLNLRKICSEVIAFNERSFRYSLKCGYKLEGTLKQEVYCDGKYWDKKLLAVFHDDWLPLWQKFKRTHGIK